MTGTHRHVCPAALAGGLDSRIRRWLQDPRRLLAPFVREGMTVLDFGCGPGFFSVELADLVGASGRVIAADVQEGMLQRLRARLRGSPLEARVVPHRCGPDGIGLATPVDFVLAFWVLHELPDPAAFFAEAPRLLAPEGRILAVEPPLHVSRAAFEASLRAAAGAGFAVVERPRIPLNKAALLRPA